MTDLERALAAGGKVTGADDDPAEKTAPAAGSPPIPGLVEPQTDLQRALAAGGSVVHTGADTPLPAPPTLGQRFLGGLKGLGNTFLGGAQAVGESAMHPIDTITDPIRRRQLERGVDDMVTGGYGQKLANRIGTTGLDKLGNLLHHGPLGDAPDVSLGATEASDQKTAPEFRQLGNVVGMVLPGAAGKIADLGGGVAQTALGGVRAAGALPRAALGAARGVVGAEVAAPLFAGLSANAEGHRLEAAREAASDPSGLALAGSLGALGSVGNRNLIGNAKSRATADLAEDITAAEGKRARATDQKRVAEVRDRLFDLTREHPELRSVWRMPAENALPLVEQAKDEVAAPISGLNAKADTMTGGGLRLGDILTKLNDQADALSKKPSTLPDADRLRTVAKQFQRAWGEPAFDPSAPVKGGSLDGMPAGKAIDVLSKLASTPGTTDPSNDVDGMIAKIRDDATGGINLDKRIPTAEFRAEVTALHKTAEAAMGGLEGTARHEALTKLYDAGKKIIDEHLDSSGMAPADLQRLRKANDQYFLLSRAESAIESRGWKEANKPTRLFPRTAHGALNASLPLAVGYGAMNPHAIPEMLGAYALGHLAPAIGSRINWNLALRPPGLALPEGRIGAGVGELRQAGQTGATDE